MISKPPPKAFQVKNISQWCRCDIVIMRAVIHARLKVTWKAMLLLLITITNTSLFNVKRVKTGHIRTSEGRKMFLCWNLYIYKPHAIERALAKKTQIFSSLLGAIRRKPAARANRNHRAATQFFPSRKSLRASQHTKASFVPFFLSFRSVRFDGHGNKTWSRVLSSTKPAKL